MGFSYKSTWSLLREISWLKHLSKDRRTRRRCDYGMYASLAMYSRAYQDIAKRDGYIGHVHGRTKWRIDKRQNAVVAYSAWMYARWASLPLSLTCVFSFLFYSPILSWQCSCKFFIVNSLVYSILPLLILINTPSPLYYTYSLRFSHSPISYFYSSWWLDACALSLSRHVLR